MIAVLLFFHAPLPIFAFFKPHSAESDFIGTRPSSYTRVHTHTNTYSACEWCFIVYAIAENIFRRVPLSIGYYDFTAAYRVSVRSFANEYTSCFDHLQSDSKVHIDLSFFFIIS